MLKIQSLASGSRGNCAYIGSETTHILVDVGLMLVTLMKRFESAGIDPNLINAVVITHEHSDHINGVYKFLKKFPNVKIYIPEYAKSCFMEKIGHIENERIITFNSPFMIGDITIDYFPVSHDSEFCFGYTFENNGAKISFATDIGWVCDKVLSKMAGSQIVMLESNHDTIKLSNNVKYPYWLKKRIACDTGHLSNLACGAATYKLHQLGCEQVILAHLSAENNSPSLAYSVVRDFLAKKGVVEGVDISIDVATQNEVGRMFCIENATRQ
ncbi:MAG: MBL fold metallo-hydrolase [Firmicutes bacterium]|nr:MBL fold metallo-hydrolase [Bacillota bacterium]